MNRIFSVLSITLVCTAAIFTMISLTVSLIMIATVLIFAISVLIFRVRN